MARNHLKLFLRIGVSLCLLVVVYAAVDLKQLLLTLSNVDLSAAALLLGMYAASQLLSAWKWNVFIREIGLERSNGFVTKAYFWGMFINTFGLGTVGGDVARGMLLKPPKGRRAAALATVVADRLHGLWSLALVAVVAVILARPQMLGDWILAIILGSVAVLAAGWWLAPRLLLRFFPEEHRYGKAARVAATAFPNSFSTLSFATFLSVLSHVLQILMHTVMAYSLGAEIPLGYLFAVVPLVNIASSFPLSINGVGIREAGYLLLFVPIGVSEEVAVSFGAIWLVSITVISALGGLILSTQFRGDQAEEPDNWSTTEVSTQEQKAV